MIKVTVKLDKAAIAKIEKAVIDSAQAAMEQVVTEVQNTAPLDQGDLINGIFVRSEKSGNTVIATIDTVLCIHVTYTMVRLWLIRIPKALGLKVV